MSALLRFENFDSDQRADISAPLAPQDADALRAAAFEEGYGAGWADALQQMRDEDALRRVGAEEALQGISFGYHEARSGLEQTFVELAARIIDTLLPEVLPTAMQQMLQQQLRHLASQQFAGRLELLCAPGLQGDLGDLLAAMPGLDIVLVEEPSYSDAQLLLRLNQSSRMIDLAGVSAALRDGLAPTPQKKEIAHG